MDLWASCDLIRPRRSPRKRRDVHFKEASSAVLAGLDMVESAPEADLPPMHIGIHTGPVIFQDGDVYGRTVNLASRIASYATAGQVLASDETAQRTSGDSVRFQPLGEAVLKGLDRPVRLNQAMRGSRRDLRAVRRSAQM